MKILLRFPLLIFIIVLSWSCKEDEEEITTPPQVIAPQVITLQGYVQKGPFINGTTILITELDDSLAATGKTFTTQITDNKGTFNIKTTQLGHNNLQLIATGFYFDEVKGEKSAAQLTLFALANVTEDAQINVNVLSHLEKERVMYLINQGKSFSEAKKQAQHEILAIFGIEKEDMANSETLDISQDGEDNAILLAISAILQGNNSVAELSELLADITFDIRKDGTLDKEKLIDTLKHNSIHLHMPSVRQYVEKRYEELGVEAVIPNFEKYIDSDGDGILNKDEDDIPDEFTFETQENVATNTEITSNEITISGISENGYITATVQNGIIIKNGELLQDSIINLVNRDKIKIQVISSQHYSQSTTATFSLGLLNNSFTVTTDDYTPDVFEFPSIFEAKRNTIYTSSYVSLTDIPYPSPVKVTNGTLLKNGQPMQEDTIYVTNNDNIQLQVQTSSAWGEEVEASLQIGEFSTKFNVTNESYPWATSLSGVVQVGPFTRNASVIVSELDSSLAIIGNAYTTTTNDNLGKYQVNNVQFDNPWVYLEAKGYYFNTVSGNNSEGELPLIGYAEITSNNKINANVLTHLETKRVNYLFNTGLSFTQAKKQALQEVLKIFEINEELSITSELFEISQSNTEAAILIAVSAILQGNEGAGTLYSLLNDISQDLENDGTLDHGTLGSALVNNVYYLDLPAIRKNLINKYKDLNVALQVPDFEKYIHAFQQNTSYEFTNPIVYPANGINGSNILAESNTTFEAYQENSTVLSYSMAANIPQNAKLKVVLKGGSWSYYGSSIINWSISSYDHNKKTQEFNIIESGVNSNVKISFPYQNQTITIEYYEYGSSTPTKTKKITITP